MNMKKNYFILLMIALLFLSCSEQDKIASYENYANHATPIVENSKTSVNYYHAKFMTGHLSPPCTGCVSPGIHINCMGAGNQCETTVSLSLSLQQNDMYQAITLYEYDLTTEDFFLMPDRSLFVELINGGKEEVWMNIPEQLAIRDSVTELFTFYDLFFTSYPVYKND